MTMHTTQALYDELLSTKIQIDKLIDSVVEDQKTMLGTCGITEVITIYDLRHKDGRPVLQDLLLAKSNVLSGMANLKVADIASKAPRR